MTLLALLLCATVLPADRIEVVVQDGHSIYGVALSPDGRYAVTGGEHDAKLWDIASGRLIRTLRGHRGPVEAVQFSRDGKSIATGSWDNVMKLWDVATGAELRSFVGHEGRLRGLAFSHDGRLLATASGNSDKRYVAKEAFDNSVRVWDVATGKELKAMRGHDGEVHAVVWSNDDSKLFSGGTDGQVRVWDAKTGAAVTSFRAHAKMINALSLSADGRRLATASRDCTASVWDAATGALVNAIPADGTGSGNVRYGGATSVALNADGTRLLTSGEDQKTRIWEVESAKQLAVLNGHTRMVTALALSTDGTRVLTGSWDSTARLWDVASARELRVFRGFSATVEAVTVSPAGDTFATAGQDNTIKLWSLATGRLVRTFVGHSDFVYDASFSPGGQQMVSASADKSVRIWDVATGRELKRLDHEDLVYAARYSPDGRWIASGGRDHNLKLWTADGAAVRTSSLGHTIMGVAFSPDSSELVVGLSDDPKAKVFSVADGTLHRALDQGDSVFSVAVSKGGLVATGGYKGDIKLWTLATGAALHTLPCPLGVNALAFNKDGTQLLTAGDDTTAKIWDVGTGALKQTFTGHTGRLRDAAWTADEKGVLTASEDFQTKLWRVKDASEAATFVGVGVSDAAAVTPDGYYAATKGGMLGVAFRRGARVFPFDQFDLRLNRPDIIAERLGQASPELVASYRKAYEKRLKRMGFSPERLADDFELPEMELLTHNLPLTTNERTLTLNLRARPAKARIDRLNISVNDVPLFGAAGLLIVDEKAALNKSKRGARPAAEVVERAVTLELSKGRNKIQLSALDARGAESMRETIEINYEGPAARPTLYLVAVGVSEYQNKEYNLNYAAKDATDLVNAFGKKRAAFADIKTLLITDGDATRSKILAARDFLNPATVDDEVVVFAAGHGLLDDQLDYFFATTDVDFEKPAARGLPYEQLEGLLDGLKSRQKLLIVDACHSGEVDKDETRVVAGTAGSGGAVKSRGFKQVIKTSAPNLKTSFELAQELFADISHGSGAAVISSASGTEFAFESSEWKNGVFTFALLEAMGQAPSLKVSELRDRATQRVSELTAGKQTPTSRRESLEFDFPVY
jgi:WD40 repeat protein